MNVLSVRIARQSWPVKSLPRNRTNPIAPIALANFLPNVALRVQNPLPVRVVPVSFRLKAAIGILNALSVQCAKYPWQEKDSSPMERTLFALIVPKKNSWQPLARRLLPHNQLNCIKT